MPPVLAKAAAELVDLAARIRACQACDRASPRRAYGTGFARAPVLLVAEHPTKADLETTGAFTDEASALDKAFEALGIALSWVYGATAVRCGFAPATTDQVAACAIHLLTEIEAVEPKVIVACGPRAVDAVRALSGKCGLTVPDSVPQGEAIRIRPGLALLATEPMPTGVVQRDAKRRLWRDLQQLPGLIAADD